MPEWRGLFAHRYGRDGAAAGCSALGRLYPEHLLYLPRIKETIPEALIIHIIRDGRDVALSTDKLGYIKRAPWDRKPTVMAAGLYWEWIVNRGRADGRKLGGDYTEVRVE